MNPNEPEKSDNTKQSEETIKDSTGKPFPKEIVDKVVSKLGSMSDSDDPAKTWSPPQKDKPKLELDLTLEDDEDYSTQPLPEDMLLSATWEKGEPPEVLDATAVQSDITISAQLVEAGDGSPLSTPSHNPPWTLQQFFNGEIDLDVELGRRFPTMPMMSLIKTRGLGTNTGRKVAELSSQDGAATMIIDADTVTKVVQLSFTFGSMLTLKFIMNDLNNMDRDRWVELMRREAGGLAFLWGTKRWASDYMICITRKHFTNLYAFSPNNFEAGVRLTPSVTTDLLDWLEQIWDEPEPDNEPPQLLTW